VKDKLRRLERAARDHLESFELLDGSRYYHDPRDPELFLHWAECLTAGNPDRWPEPPEAVRKVAEAKDPRAALESIRGGGSWDMLPYDPEALVRERDIRPRSLVTGRDVYDQKVEGYSEKPTRAVRTVYNNQGKIR
jgi:hypothetical protein